ncbi:translesion DNA synthesis-associated protein ImuA [Andreprevotia sp. IGB-42]|uniref:translesion DNA synthesis-associated protein ImuA n=1 Tax=Andreprevotia sp. IGB-42 TaxID=2497473 RepID=UPI00135B22E2|nr:translesion DNA synthesis-associated protein ImuA [Andreprevotia sp. IGB-42]
MAPELMEVLKHPAVWRGGSMARADAAGVSSAYPALDAVLPGGGWPLRGMAELLLAKPGSGELALLLPALRQISQRQHVLLIQPPHIPYAPAWQAAGVLLSRLVWVRPRSVADALWAMEQGLRDSGCGAVLGWAAGQIDDRACRRLQLAAQAGAACGFLLRLGARADSASPLPLRLGVEPATGGVQVRILKRRGPPLAQPIHLTSHLDSRIADHALVRPLPAAAAAGSLPARRSRARA